MGGVSYTSSLFTFSGIFVFYSRIQKKSDKSGHVYEHDFWDFFALQIFGINFNWEKCLSTINFKHQHFFFKKIVKKRNSIKFSNPSSLFRIAQQYFNTKKPKHDKSIKSTNKRVLLCGCVPYFCHYFLQNS